MLPELSELVGIVQQLKKRKPPYQLGLLPGAVL